MFYVIKIKWIVCVLKKQNFIVCHRDQGSAQSKFQEISPLLQRKSIKTDCKNIFSGVEKAGAFLPRGGIWNHMPPMATGLVGPCRFRSCFQEFTILCSRL